MSSNKSRYWLGIVILLYIALCVYILTSYVLHERAWLDGEIYTIYFFKMSVISFPLGLIVSIVADYALSFLNLGQKTSALTLWALMTITGALQWFVVLPTCYSGIKRKIQSK